MNPYTLALGLALAGEARAEEPKCIDKIVLDIRIDDNPKDPVSQLFHTDYNKGVTMLLEPMRLIYSTDLGLSVETGQVSADTKEVDHIIVRYTTPERAIIEISQWPREDQLKLLQDLRGYESPQISTVDLSEAYRGFFEAIGGVAVSEKHIIYLFQKFSAGTSDDNAYFTTRLGYILAHETGHIFGLSHGELLNELQHGIRNIMTEPTLEGARIIEADKATILKQVCKEK